MFDKPQASMTFKKNCAHAHYLASTKLIKGDPVDGQCYNIGDGDTMNRFAYIEYYAKAASLVYPIVSVPWVLILMIAWIADWLDWALHLIGFQFNFSFNPVVARQMGVEQIIPIDKLQRDLGFKPLVPRGAAMKETRDWFLDQQEVKKGKKKIN